MTTSVCVLGTGPGAAKSAFCVAACRALARGGVAVAPFKAIAVVEDDGSCDKLVPLSIAHQAKACHIEWEPAMYPVVVKRIRRDRGRLAIRGEWLGEVALLNNDCADLAGSGSELTEIVRHAVRTAYREVTWRYETVVIEGAGSPTDAPEQDDIANVFMARLAAGAVVLVANFSKGGAGSGVLGTGMLLPPDVRQMLRGFVFSDVWIPESSGLLAELVRDMLGVPLIKSIGHLPYWEDSEPGDPRSESAYDAWADAVEDEIFRILESQQ